MKGGRQGLEKMRKMGQKRKTKQTQQINRQTIGSPVCLQRMVPAQLLRATTRFSGML